MTDIEEPSVKVICETKLEFVFFKSNIIADKHGARLLITYSEWVTRLYIHVQLTLLSILNGLDVIRLFLFDWDFPTGGESLVGFGQNDPQNIK